MRALALVCLVPGVIANFLLRPRELPPPPPLPPSTTKKASPHTNKTTPAAAAAAAVVTTQPDPRIFRTRGYTRTVIAIFLSQFASFGSLTYLSAYMLGKGFAHAFSFDVVAVVNASSAARHVAAVACFAVWLPAGGAQPGIVAFSLLFRLATGAGSCLTPVAVGRLCRAREHGRHYGTCYSLVSLAVLAAVPLPEGVVRAAGGDYWGLVAVTGLVYIAAAFAFALAKVEVVGKGVWVAF